MNPLDRMKRCRILMQKKSPFFGYLVLNLKLTEFPDQLKKLIPKERLTCAVDIYNNLYYNPDWIANLDDDSLSGVIIHETLHVGFNHMVLSKGRNPELCNIAQDIVINNLIVNAVGKDRNRLFKLPKEGLIPKDNSIRIWGAKIDDIDKKCWEQVYDELMQKCNIKTITVQMMSDMGFDTHIKSGSGSQSEKENDKLNEGQRKGRSKDQLQQDMEKQWKGLMMEALTHARLRGDLPAGMERVIDEYLDTKIDWRTALYKYITNTIVSDYDFRRMSKKSVAVGCYMPRMRKEEVEVMVSIDTSGSIAQKELTEFISEMVYMSKSFENLKMTCIICDCKVHDVIPIENGHIAKLENLKIKGGGGTSHQPVVDLIDEEYPNTRILVNFTDGYTDHVDVSDKSYNTLWVVCSNGDTSQPEANGGEIIKL